MKLTTYVGSAGYYVAPEVGPGEEPILQRVSPYYPTQAAAEKAAAEKQREYDEAEGGGVNRRIRRDALRHLREAHAGRFAHLRPVCRGLE